MVRKSCRYCGARETMLRADGESRKREEQSQESVDGAGSLTDLEGSDKLLRQSLGR